MFTNVYSRFSESDSLTRLESTAIVVTRERITGSLFLFHYAHRGLKYAGNNTSSFSPIQPIAFHGYN